MKLSRSYLELAMAVADDVPEVVHGGPYSCCGSMPELPPNLGCYPVALVSGASLSSGSSPGS